MKDYETYIFDIDGTLLAHHKPLPGAVEIIRFLRKGKKTIFFVTNNPFSTNEALAKRLNASHIEAYSSEIITPIQAVTSFLQEEKHVSTILALLDPTIRKYLELQGWRIVASEDKPDRCSHVLLGLHEQINYIDFAVGLQMLDKGAKLVLLNKDLFCPVENGRIPDTGALSAVFEKCCNEKPIAIGKPSIWMQKVLEKHVKSKPKQTLFIGDSPFTDIKIGRALKMHTLLVKTGVTNYQKGKVRSTYVHRSLEQTLRRLKNNY